MSESKGLSVNLEEWAPYLVNNKARPGDVILLRGSGLLSASIATATAGRYSHAMLLLPLGWGNQWIAAEADSLGVGLTQLMPITLENSESNSFIFAMSIPNRPVAWQLYRHPAIAKISNDTLLAASKRIQSKEFYLSYSMLHRLIAPVPANKKLKASVSSLVSFLDSSKSKQRSHGSFCSELVALFYSELGVELFDQPRPPSHVSPNDLADGRSLLVPVTDAFIDLSDKTQWKARKQFDQIPMSRSTMLPHLVSRNHIAGQVKKKTTEILETGERILAHQLSQAELMASQILDQMRVSESQYMSLRESSRAAAIRMLMSQVELATHLHQDAQEEYLAVRSACDDERAQELASGDGLDPDDPKDYESERIAREGALATASAQITIIATGLSEEAQHKYLRLTTLFALKVNAKLTRVNKSPFARWKASRTRAKFLRDWKFMRVKLIQARSLKQDLLLTLKRTEASDLAVQLIMEAAIRKMTHHSNDTLNS